MVRRYGDPVEVRAGQGEQVLDGDPPGSFLWRGRVYRVRSILGHWRERRAWWTEAAARAVHGAEVDPGDQAGTESGPGLAEEREIWRVEAGAGRLAAVGVFDLCRDPKLSWSLLRVAD
jgi:hypothetical protein